jgi:redox-sensitive bicupin YhaK (pirin superfamily)
MSRSIKPGSDPKKPGSDPRNALSARSVKRIHPAARDDIGDLVTRRPLPGPGLEQLDPFLFLNHHGPQVYPPHNRGLPFGPHPHRGFETVSFIVQGAMAHADSGGHESVIREGGVQWMTAGRGIVHSEHAPEDLKARGGPFEVLQLWLNLPAKLKMTAPHYVGVQRAELPVIELDGGKAQVTLVSGELEGRKGPIESLTAVFMATVELERGARIALAAPRGRTVFLYVVRGEVRVGGTPAPQHQLVELDDDGDQVGIEAASDALLLFGHADPIGEPVVAYGPFVMNTTDEIDQALRDYREGRFDPPARG